MLCAKAVVGGDPCGRGAKGGGERRDLDAARSREGHFQLRPFTLAEHSPPDARAQLACESASYERMTLASLPTPQGIKQQG